MNVGSELWYAPKQQHDTLEPPIIRWSPILHCMTMIRTVVSLAVLSPLKAMRYIRIHAGLTPHNPACILDPSFACMCVLQMCSELRFILVVTGAVGAEGLPTL